MEDLIYIRVLQHDTEDQIRIGNAYPVTDLDKAEKNIVALYEKEPPGAAVSKLLVSNITSVLPS